MEQFWVVGERADWQWHLQCGVLPIIMMIVSSLYWFFNYHDDLFVIVQRFDTKNPQKHFRFDIVLFSLLPGVLAGKLCSWWWWWWRISICRLLSNRWWEWTFVLLECKHKAWTNSPLKEWSSIIGLLPWCPSCLEPGCDLPTKDLAK